MRKARALRLIRRLKAADAEVSDWEGEFLSSVEGRLDQYGRAFSDPEKGAPEAALSALQQRKLKEIKAKVSGDPAPERMGRWTRKRPLGARKKVRSEAGEAD